MEPRHTRASSITKRVFQLRSGIPSFDEILSGGIPLGTLILVEETSRSDISSSFTKAFLGEGAVNQEHLFYYSDTPDSAAVPDIKRIGNLSVRGDFTVRYESYAENSEIQEPYAIDISSIRKDYKNCIQRTLDCSTDDFYHNLWKSIKNDLKSVAEGARNMKNKRIVIKSMFGINWPHRSLSEIFEFLKSVKTLLRSRNMVCMITAPIAKISDSLKQLVLGASDLVIVSRQAEGTQRKISIYKAPRSVKIDENSIFLVSQSQGTTILEPIS